MTAVTSGLWSEEELRRNIGQLFIVGFHGHTPSADVKTLIKKHKVGAIILFSRNVGTASELLALTNSLQEIAKDSGHKQGLFIAIDQENGLVTRIKHPVAAQLPGAMALGATKDPLNAYKIAAATAETLKSFGINMNYAPIADVNSEPENPVIGVRSPSDDPETVGRFVAAQIRALQDGGIVTSVKHFPGHGDTAVDSHYGLPIINKTKAQLQACELIPFRRAIAEGVTSIMTAHISIPGISKTSLKDAGLSKQLPASLNPDAIKILREEMKYDGMIISDCLEMDGVRATFGTEEGAVMAFEAGTDCVMICHTMSAQVAAIENVVQAVQSGKISQGIIEACVKRVENLKVKYVSPSNLIPAFTLATVDARNSAQTTLASEIYAKSTTVVRSVAGSFPIAGSNKNIVFLSPGESSAGSGAVESGEGKTREPHTPASYIEVLRAHDPRIIDIKFYDGVSLTPEERSQVTKSDYVILVTRNAGLSLYQKDCGLSLGRELGDKLIVIATSDPYDFLEQKDEIKNYVTIYEPTIPAFKSAADIIFGVTIPQGSLPVGVPSVNHGIRAFTGSSEDVSLIFNLWHTSFPIWPIALPRLAKILNQPHGRHHIHDKGFCISYLTDGGNGKIAAVGVSPEYRTRGLGTALIGAAQAELRHFAPKSGIEELNSLEIGSDFPRLWPQVPIDFAQSQKEFLLHRGFFKAKAPTARDLFRDIRNDVAPSQTLARVARLNLKFSPWSPALYEECMAKQRENFKNKGWINAYERLAAANQHHEVMVAFDPDTNAQVGWTLMCSNSCVISDDFAFLPLMPSGEKTGLIACVGVDESARGRGVGLALLVKAMENMRERGVEGVCIDWVVIRGFYETLGYEVCWEYEGYIW